MAVPRDAGAVLENVNIAEVAPLLAPVELRHELPLDDASATNILTARRALADIIGGRDPRMVVVVGPCSIHDTGAAREYLARLSQLSHELAEELFVVMRVYFEKPRTTVGWKGLINDPHLDDSFDIECGLRRARELLLELARAGMPAATEALDPIVPQYLGDLISWYAIGARTTESQTHREMASGLSAPCGFKNGTDGGVEVACQAMQAAATPHHFLGIDVDGRTAVIRTHGNRQAHVILRGGGTPNYDAVNIALCLERLLANGLEPAVMVDCSHGNSAKDPERQSDVARDVVGQRVAGNDAIMGLMLESHLHAGKQTLSGDRARLRYGVSITDGCIDWASTATLLREIAMQLREKASSFE